MNSIKTVTSVVWVLLSLVLSVSAQTSRRSIRLDNPTVLPSNRVSITAATATNIDMLGFWGLGNFSDIVWIDETHLAIAASIGIWIYDLTHPDAPAAVIPYSGPRVPTEYRSILLVSPDGQWLGAIPPYGRRGDSQAGFGVWHIPTGNRIALGWSDGGQQTQPGNAGFDYEPPPRFVDWLPDNRYLTARGEDVVLWELSLGNVSKESIFRHTRTERTSYHIEQVDVSQNMRWIATAIRSDISEQVIVQLWDIGSGERRIFYEDELLPEIPLYTQSIWFNADDSEVALLVRHPTAQGSYQYQQAIWRWDVETGEALTPYEIDCSGPVIEINFAYGYIVCGERDYQSGRGKMRIQMFNLSDSTPLSEPIWIEDTVGIVNQTLVTVGEMTTVINQRNERSGGNVSPHNVIIWDDTGKQVAALDVGLERVNRAAISPDGSLIALMQNGQAQVWNIGSASHQLTLAQNGLLTIENLAASPDGRYLIVIGAYPDPVLSSAHRHPTRTLCWDLQLGTFEVIPNQDAAYSAAYSPDGSQFVLGRRDGMLHVYNAETLVRQNVLFNDGFVGQLAYSTGGRLLAVASDRYVRFWDTRSWTVINRVDARSGFFYDRLLFTADDEWLVYNYQVWKIEGNGSLVARWDAENASEEVHALLPPRTPIRYPTHSYRASDGLLLHTLTLFDVTSGNSLWNAGYVEEYTIPAVALTQDLIIAGGWDGVLRLYGIANEGER